jgi:hypothetical protein
MTPEESASLIAKVSEIQKRNNELVSVLEEILKVMQECIEDLTQYIDAEYPNRGQYRDETRKHQRDMDIVFRSTLLIIKAKEKINER